VRVAFLGGTGPVGAATVPRLLAAGHAVLVAHTGAHEPPAVAAAEHVHGARADLLPAVAAWRPDCVVDTFPGGATAAKARELRALGAPHVVAVSSLDVYAHCADAGVDDAPPAALARHAVPLAESAALRRAHPPGTARDNVAMEAALAAADGVCVLRPGAIYGPHVHAAVLREWFLVGRVARGERRLALPDGGTQLFHRVALERVARAVVAAAERRATGAVNVVDPADLTFGGLAALVAERLGWAWELVPVAWPDGDHPWNVRHPVLAADERLRRDLAVVAPDPRAATLAQVDWLWKRRAELAAWEESGGAR